MPGLAALYQITWFFELIPLWVGQKLRRTASRFSETPPKNILVLGYAAIGDTLFLLPAFQELRKAFPSAHITYLANRSAITTELIPATGLFDKIEHVEWWEGKTWENRGSVTMRIRDENYDAMVVSLASPVHFFQKAVARIPLRIGHCSPLTPPPGFGFVRGILWKLRRAIVTGEAARRFLLDHKIWTQPEEHMLTRNLKLLGALGLPVPETPPKPAIPLPELKPQLAAQISPAPGHKLVGIHLGVPSNPYFKMWAAEKLGRLCRRLQDSGKVDCVFIGGPEEQLSVEIARKAAGSSIRSLAGECSLLETFAAIRRCDLFIGNDAGPVKAAMALGVPTVTLWGPTRPIEYGAIWDAERHLDLRTDIACSPCSLTGMPYPRANIDFRSCGHHDCLNKMDVEWVYGKIFSRIFGKRSDSS